MAFIIKLQAKLFGQFYLFPVHILNNSLNFEQLKKKSLLKCEFTRFSLKNHKCLADLYSLSPNKTGIFTSSFIFENYLLITNND